MAEVALDQYKNQHTEGVHEVQPNSEAAMELEKEMSARREQAAERADFHSREARIYSAVDRACSAALEALNQPQSDSTPNPRRL